MLIEIVGREILDDTELDGRHSSSLGTTIIQNKIYVPILSYRFYKKNELRFLTRLEDKLSNYFVSRLGVSSGFYCTGLVEMVEDGKYGIFIEVWDDSMTYQRYLVYVTNARAI